MIDDAVCRALLDEIDIGVFVTDHQLRAVLYSNRRGVEILAAFRVGVTDGARRTPVPPTMRDAVIRELGRPAALPNDRFPWAIRVTTPDGTTLFLRAKRMMGRADACLLLATVRVARERDLAIAAKERYGVPPHATRLLGLIRAGMNNQAIALRLGLSLGTVKGYVTEILAAFGVKNRVELLVVLDHLESANGDQPG